MQTLALNLKDIKIDQIVRFIYFYLLLLCPCLSALDELSALHFLCLFLFLYVYPPSFSLYSIALPLFYLYKLTLGITN